MTACATSFARLRCPRAACWAPCRPPRCAPRLKLRSRRRDAHARAPEAPLQRPGAPLKKKAAGSATAPPQVKTSNFPRKARPGRQLGLTPQRQLERYREMAKDDSAQTFKVYARVREGARVERVGLISAPSRTTLPAAVQAQKRLILGHAGRAYPALAAQQSLLERSAVAADAAADAAEGSPPRPPAPAKECGFAATADDGSGHYFGETTRIAGEGKKVILNGMKDDHKSKVAQQFSKSLGLRSG